MAKDKEKDEQIQIISEELSGIREAIEDLSGEINELHQSIMLIGLLKIAEIRPDMKEKMDPIFKEMISSFGEFEDEE
jgi:prefoldin subunit 5